MRTRRIGLITGSGGHALAALAQPRRIQVQTRFGEASVARGRIGAAEVLHISRHENGHVRLSHQIDHRANVAALVRLGADCAMALTACGALEPSFATGELIVFDDLYFPSNRLPDGSLCTFHTDPGDPARAHWIFERPFADGVRRALADAARAAGLRVHDGGCYGHVDGPRFNTAAEVRALRASGVCAISQTAGPETVLFGEAGIPFALAGLVTDYANGVAPVATSVEELLRNIAHAARVADALAIELAARLAGARLEAPGVSHGFERDPHVYGRPSRNGHRRSRLRKE